MPVCVALLRAVNVGGRNRLAMRELLAMTEELGLRGCKTLLQSGNLIIPESGVSPGDLERVLEEETARRFGMSIDIMVRTPDEWQHVIEVNPFPQEAKKEPNRLLVMFLKEAPSSKPMIESALNYKGPERLAFDRRQIYLYYPSGAGVSKLTGNSLERQLEVRGTARNWNTVLKLGDLLDAM